MTIAERLIDFCHEHGDVVTNLKLQKLLYYCQAWYLALYGTPLFAQSFEAWPVGPVQPEVYSRYRSFADRPIERSRQEWHLPKKVEQHVEDLMASYGRLSAFELERLSCQESPWIEARHGLDADQWSDAKISAESMQRFYKARLDEQEKARG